LKPFPNFKVHHFFFEGFVDVFEPFYRVGLNVVVTTNSTSSPKFHDVSMSTTLVSVFFLSTTSAREECIVGEEAHLVAHIDLEANCDPKQNKPRKVKCKLNYVFQDV
jgi:hypothetical protein